MTRVKASAVRIPLTGTTCSVGGIMTSTEIDVGNLKKWLQGSHRNEW